MWTECQTVQTLVRLLGQKEQFDLGLHGVPRSVCSNTQNHYIDKLYLSRLMTKPTMWLCAQRRLRSAWASAQSDQSSLCAQWVAMGPRFLHADSEDSESKKKKKKKNELLGGVIFLEIFCMGSLKLTTCVFM